MLTQFQIAKLEDWANHVLVNGVERDNMPRGIRQVDMWVVTGTAAGFAFPKFDTEQPYTFGE